MYQKQLNCCSILYIFSQQIGCFIQDIRNLVAVRILVGVLQFRIVSRYSSNHVGQLTAEKPLWLFLDKNMGVLSVKFCV